jgi:hypothetical protein
MLLESAPCWGSLMDKSGDGLPSGVSAETSGVFSELLDLEQNLEATIETLAQDNQDSELQADLRQALHHIKAAHRLMEELQ